MSDETDPTATNEPRPAPAVSYAVAWQREGGPRLVGSALVEADGLVLTGREAGAHNGETQLHLTGAEVGHVELRRSSALPAVSLDHGARPLVIELLMGGWGAAHDLADSLARPLDEPAATEEAGTTTVAIAAKIIPGKHAELEHILETGLPAKLRDEGVHVQEACLGDDDLVLILSGPDAIVHTLARTGLGLHGAVSQARQLGQIYSWRRGGGVTAGSA